MSMYKSDDLESSLLEGNMFKHHEQLPKAPLPSLNFSKPEETTALNRKIENLFKN
jgi:hypothetical protein